MTTSSPTAPSVTPCPAWCENPSCGGDHYSIPGTNWPGVKATAWPQGGNHEVVAYPTWGEIDGLRPAVCLFIDGDLKVNIDLTPAEAQQLIERFQTALAAVAEL
jgi:hypothetical protein